MTTPKKIACPQCGAKYETARGLSSHMRNVHGVAGSARSAVAAREKKQRDELAAKAKVFKCPECGEKFPSNMRLGLHRRAKHGVKGEARSSIVSRQQRDIYMANYERDADGLLLCPECGKGFKEVGIAIHRKQAHKIPVAEQARLFEITNQQPAVVAKIEMVADEADGARCPHCDFVAVDERGLRKHLSSKHDLYSQTPIAIYKRELRNKNLEQPTQVTASQTTNNGHNPEDSRSLGSGIPEAAVAFTAGRVEELLSNAAAQLDLPTRTFTRRVIELVHAKTVWQ